jgi:hypothetical protein
LLLKRRRNDRLNLVNFLIIISNLQLKMSAKPAENKVTVKQPTMLASASTVSFSLSNKMTETTVALN